jgi:hypothetical protein
MNYPGRELLTLAIQLTSGWPTIADTWPIKDERVADWSQAMPCAHIEQPSYCFGTGRTITDALGAGSHRSRMTSFNVSSDVNLTCLEASPRLEHHLELPPEVTGSITWLGWSRSM